MCTDELGSTISLLLVMMKGKCSTMVNWGLNPFVGFTSYKTSFKVWYCDELRTIEANCGTDLPTYPFRNLRWRVKNKIKCLLPMR